MKKFNFLSNLLQRVFAMSGMRAEAINPDGQPTVNRRSSMTSVQRHDNASGARVAREAIEAHRRVSGGQSRSKCAAQVRKANIELLKAEWLKYAAAIMLVLTIGVGNVWADETFDFTKAPSSSSNSTVTWTGTDVTITLAKNSSSTNANNYIPTSRSYTRMYSKQKLTFAPKNSKEISSVSVTLQNASYPIKGTATNCSVSTSSSTTTITPTNGKNEFNVVLSANAYVSSIKVIYKAATFSVTVKSPTGRGAYTDVSVTDKTKMFASGAFSQVVAKHKACTWSDSYMEAWNNAYVDYEISKANKVSTKPTNSGTKHIYTTEAGLPSSGTLYPLFVYGGYYYTEATCPTLFVNYDSNGATSGTAPSDGNNYDPGDDVTVLGQGTLTRTNYTFTGWNTESDGSGMHYDENDHFDMPDEDVYLYAEWCKDLSKSSITVNEPTLTSYNSGTGKWTVNVTWTAVDGATYYTVQCGDRATSTVVLSETNVGNVTSYSISNLTNAHEHRIIVTAKHACDVTQKQGKVDFTPTCDKDVSAVTPTVNATTSITKTGATANWVAVSDADHYTVKVYQGTTVAGDPVKTYDNVTSTSQAITGLTANTDYIITVQAHDACGHNSVVGSGGQFKTQNLTLYTVTFHNAAGSAPGAMTQTTEGGTVSIPSASACEGWTFVGWKVGSALSSTTTDPTSSGTWITSASWPKNYAPDGNIDVYAVFSKTEGGGAAVTDELTPSAISNPSSYSDWSDKSLTSNAVYAGQSSGGNSYLQLRSKNSNSGVVMTTSGGNVTKVAVTWNSSTQSGRTLNVYGKNSAYSAATDLYNASNQGTLVGTIVYGTSTELDITEDYAFIGFRSDDGAMYLDEVDITIGGGGTTTWRSDPPCCEKLDAVGGTWTTANNIAIDGTNITVTVKAGNVVANASGYRFVLYNEAGTSEIAHKDVNSNSAPVSTTFTSSDGVTLATNYKVSVITLGDGSTYCDEGNESSKIAANVPSAATWTVTYNKNTTDEVTGMPASPLEVLQATGSGTLSDATPTRTGYTFGGWSNTSGSGNTADYSAGGTISGVTADKTIYAVWTAKPTYTITLNAGNGTISDGSWTAGVSPTWTQTQAHGDASIMFPTASCNCAGWVFQGWKLGSAADNQSSFTPDQTEGSSLVPTGNVTYYAVYRQNSTGGTTYNKITDIGDLTTGTYVIKTSSYAMKNTYDWYSSGGYYHMGEESNSGSDASITNTSAAIAWTIIKFGSNYAIKNGSNFVGIDGDGLLVYDETMHLFTAAYDGTNNGWVFTSTENTSYQLVYNYYYRSLDTQSTAILLYKQGAGLSGNYYTNPVCSDYTVTGVANPAAGGSVTLSATSGKTGDKVYAYYTEDPAYRFNNWSVTGTGATLSSTSAQLTELTIGTANVTLTANFAEKVIYTVTWNVNGSTYTTGSPSASAESGTKWSALTLPTAPADNTLSECDRTKFVGWSTSQLFGEGNSAPSDLFKTVEDANADSHTITGTTTFYAVFAKGSGDGWEKVSSAPDNWCGDYLLAYEASASSVFVWNGSTDASNYVEATPSDGLISKPTGGVEITIEHFGETANYAIKVKEGTNKDKYFKGNSSNGFTLEDTQQNTTIGSVEDIGFTFTNSSSYLRFNTTSGQTRFRYYKSTTAKQSSYKTIALYQQASNYSDYATQCCTLKPVTNLAVSSTTANSVTLTWTAPSTTTGIDHLELRNASTDAKIGSNIAVGTTTTSVSGLVECNTYSYKIVSVGAVCETSSEVVEAQPFSGAKTVTFNYNGGSGSPTSFTTSCAGSSVTLPTPDTRTGYTFLGWWSAQNGGTKKGDAGGSYTVSGTTTLWAHWAQNFTVTYDLNGGAADPICSGGTYYVGQSVTVCSTTPTKTSSSFLGWKRLDTGATVAGGSTFTMPSNNVTIQAQWETVYFHIYYKEEDGTAIATDDVPQTAETTLRNQTPCVGYTFFGWSTSKITSETTSKPSIIGKGGASYTPNADITVYPVYARVEGASDKNDVITKDACAATNSTYTAFSNVSLVSDAKYAGSSNLTSGDMTIRSTDGFVTTASGGRIKHVKVIFASGCTQPRSIYVYGKNEAYNTFAAGSFPTGATLGTKIATATKTTAMNTGEVTVELPAADTEFDEEYNYIAIGTSTDGAVRLTSITVTWSTGTTYYATHCETKTDVTVTYNGNGGTVGCGSPADGAITSVTWDYKNSGADAPTLASVQTICASATRSGGYILRDWTTSADGTGTHYTPGASITSLANDITLYAQWDRVYTVTFNDQGTTTPVTQASASSTVAVPGATTPCIKDGVTWTFAGWGSVSPLSQSLAGHIIIPSGTSTYTPTEDVTLYAVYSKALGTSDEFAVGTSGAYKISVHQSGNTCYATTKNAGGTAYYCSTTVGDAGTFYLTYVNSGVNAGKYTLQNSAGEYIGHTASSASLTHSTTTPEYYNVVSANGGFRLQFANETDRYFSHGSLSSDYNYSAKKETNECYFTPAAASYYYTTMSCDDDFNITFHENGGTITWNMPLHGEGTYQHLADGTEIDVFPTATFDGWTFIGWRAADYDESTTAPEASTIYGGSDGESGNHFTIHSNTDMYPVFTRFEDNEPFDQINGGDYYIYFLDESSDDGYGAAQRVYAASYESQKRYNSSALCSAATTFTFTKLENGNWTIYDNTTHMYLYGIGDDDLKQQASATGAEWTLTINGNQFDAFHVGSSYGQLIAQGDGTSATIMNYRRTNVTTNPAMYHRVYLGSCTNRTFTTNPSTTPEIDLKGTVVVTASQNGAVRNTNVLTVSGHNLTPSTGEITITSNNSDVYFSTSNTASFALATANQPKSSITVSANSSGIVVPTPVYVHYKPSSNTDTWTSATITASYTGAEDAEVTGELRTVKENFVIAAKVGGNWYALPANMAAEGVFEPVLIDVDESAKIAYGPATVGYKMWPVQTVNGGTDEYAANGDKVRFAGNSNAGLWASNSNNHIRNWATITAIGSTAETPASYEWIIETEDREAYTLKSMYSTNYLDLYRPSSGAHAGKLVWASNSTYETNEIHFFPLTEREVITIIPREWKANGLVFSVAADNQITAASYKIGTGSETSTTYTRHSTGGYGLYEVALPDLTSQYGKLLTLKLTISGTPTYATTTIPIIVNANASTKDSEPFVTLCAATKDYDVVVLDGKTLTTDASASGACKFQNLYIYPGATLVNAANNNLSVRYLELRGGIKGIDHKSDLAQGVPHLKLDKNFSSTAGANLDMYVNTAHSYALSVPFNVTLSTVNFANSLNTTTSEPINGALDAQFMIMEYDGAQRASTGKGWKHITSTERVLHAGEGYVLQGKRPKGQPFAVIRFPFSSVSGWADGSGEVTKSEVSISEHAGGASTPDNDKGWNLLANPYMATLSYNGADEGWAADFTVGSLVKTDTDPWDGKYEWTSTTNAYVTMPNEWYTEFPQYRANSAQAVFEPFKNFFIQASANGSVTFDKSKRASAPRHLLAQETKAQPIYADINLTHGEAFAQAGLTVDENATAGYKFGEDQNIFENREALTYLKMYTVADGHYLVGNTMTPAETEELIPVEFYAPNAGEYIFSLDDNSDIDRLEYVILYDAVLGLNTNLLTNDYMVELDETGLIENRFSIGLRIKEKDNSATGIGDVSGDPERPYKFIYRDKMYILRGGKIYDATGKQVREIK